MKILSQIVSNKTARIFLIIVFSTLALYVSTVAQTPTAFGDSDELITAGYLLTVPHPPGYPFQIVLTYLATHFIPVGTIAFRSNLLSAFFIAITSGLVYLINLHLLTQVKHANHKHILSVISGLIYAFSYQIWTFANVTEVFALHMFFLSFAMYLTLKISTTPSPLRLTISLLAGLIGLGLSHHQTFILALPGIAIILWPQLKPQLSPSKPTIKALSIMVITFLLPLSLLLPLNARAQTQPVSWKFQPTLTGIYKFYTRADYSGISVEDQQLLQAYVKGLHPPQNIQTLIHYFTHLLPQNFSIIIAALLIFSWIIFYSSTLPTPIKRGLTLTLLLTGPLLAAYLILPTQLGLSPEYFTERAYAERIYLAGYLIWTLPLGLGLNYLLNFLQTRIKNPNIAYALLLLPIYLIYTNYSSVNLRHYDLPYQYTQASLTQLQPDSVIICFSDVSCFSLFYAQYVQNLRPDVTVVTVTPQYRNHSNYASLQKFSYQDNPFRIADIISYSQSLGRHVYVSEIPQFYLDWLGLEGQTGYLQPTGYYYQIQCSPPTYTDFQGITSQAITLKDSRNTFQQTFKAALFQNHVINGTLYAHLGETDHATQQFTSAHDLFPKHPEPTSRIAQLSTYQGNPRYAPDQTCLSGDQLLAQAQQCLGQGDQSCFLSNLYHATIVAPFDPTIRQFLADYFFRTQQPLLAKREYQHLLLLQPDNAHAQQQLQVLSTVPQLNTLPLQ